MILQSLTFSSLEHTGHLFCSAQLLSRVHLFATPWTVARQAPLSMAFSRQEYWSGLPFLPPGDPPDPGVEPVSPASLHWQADSGKSLILQNGSQFGIFIFNKQTSNET